MISEQQELIDQLFTRALDLPADGRGKFLRRSVVDEYVRQEVLALLDASMNHALELRLDAIRERMLKDVVATIEPDEDSLTGQRVGRWLVGESLARGGLATVYLAHRNDGEYDQQVALKVLRRGLDTDDLVARFRAERQILSTLDHPSIAKILDGGALPDGRPFLVLEYVAGTSITLYCETVDVDIDGRVRLIIDVLRALHHAHKHLVVHRDIKPSNILVSKEGNVSLLDFGIAKLLDPEALPGLSTKTRAGVSLLTPGYGSPEQRTGQAVTTASDIYQVGLVLYEMLSGTRPERDDGIQAPSSQMTGTRQRALVKGDLDAIVLKAMHDDPGARYGSANEMVADLERYLQGLPVLAQHDTVFYRLRKLTQRKPWLVPGAGVIVLGVATYLVTLTLYSAQLRIEQQRAQAAQAFIVDLLSSADPFAPADPDRGRSITVLEAVEIGRSRLQHELLGQPELRATLLGSVADVYGSLDQNTEAIALREQTLALNQSLYGEQSDAVLEDLRLLGELYSSEGDYRRAREHFERQLAIARKTFAADDARLGIAEAATGRFESFQGNVKNGPGMLLSGIDKMREAPEAHAISFIGAIMALTEQDGLNDPHKTQPLLDEALAVAESVYGRGSLYAANVLLAIARNAFYLEDLDRANSIYADALNIFHTQLGPLHATTISHLNNYGFLLMGIGDYAGAERIHQDLVGRLIESRGEKHRMVADNYQNLGSAIHRQGRFKDALPLHWKAYEIYGEVLEHDHYVGVFPLLSIAYIELQRDNPQAAERAAADALATFRATVPDSVFEGVALCLVGVAREQAGDAAQGASIVEASHALLNRGSLAGSPYLTLCRIPEAINLE